MQRYYALNYGSKPTLSDDDVFHIKNIMRYKVNDEFELIYDEKIYQCRIISFKPFTFDVLFEIFEKNELDTYIRFFYCIPKGSKLDLVIQKAVELGVKEFVLIQSNRSIAKIDERNKDNKLTRFNKIIKEATEQSKRKTLMKLNDVITFNDLNKYKGDINLICFENSSANLNDLLKELKSIKGKTVNVIVGAEGGITKEELETAKKENYIDVTLGRRILRSETACIYILSLLSFFAELE